MSRKAAAASASSLAASKASMDKRSRILKGHAAKVEECMGALSYRCDDVGVEGLVGVEEAAECRFRRMRVVGLKVEDVTGEEGGEHVEVAMWR